MDVCHRPCEQPLWRAQVHVIQVHGREDPRVPRGGPVQPGHPRDPHRRLPPPRAPPPQPVLKTGPRTLMHLMLHPPPNRPATPPPRSPSRPVLQHTCILHILSPNRFPHTPCGNVSVSQHFSPGRIGEIHSYPTQFRKKPDSTAIRHNSTKNNDGVY